MASKTRRKILEAIYDHLYNQADKILKENNPCGHCILNGTHSCHGKRDFSALKGSYGDNTSEQACCIGCGFWNRNLGCTNNKPLSCKVWLCGTSENKHPLIMAALDKIKQYASVFWFVSHSTERQGREFSINFALKMLGNRNGNYSGPYKTNKELIMLAKERNIL